MGLNKGKIQASLKRTFQLKINHNMNEQIVRNESSVLTERSQNFDVIELTQNNKTNQMFKMIKAIMESIKIMRIEKNTIWTDKIQ